MPMMYGTRFSEFALWGGIPGVHVLHFSGCDEDFYYSRASAGAAVKALEDNNLVILSGASGSGKTLLLSGFTAEYKEKNPDKTAMMVSSSDFLGRMISAVKGSKLNPFKDEGQLGLFVLDDADLITGIEAIRLVGVIIEDICASGGKVIISMEETPGIALIMDAVNGVSNCAHVKMKTPGMLCRVQVALKWKEENNIAISDKELVFFAARIKNISALRGAMTGYSMSGKTAGEIVNMYCR
jgi:chromosomal replication initiation ATPase DnaA